MCSVTPGHTHGLRYDWQVTHIVGTHTAPLTPGPCRGSAKLRGCFSTQNFWGGGGVSVPCSLCASLLILDEPVLGSPRLLLTPRADCPSGRLPTQACAHSTWTRPVEDSTQVNHLLGDERQARSSHLAKHTGPVRLQDAAQEEGRRVVVSSPRPSTEVQVLPPWSTCTHACMHMFCGAGNGT